jgi:uncharacterized protein YoxC
MTDQQSHYLLIFTGLVAAAVLIQALSLAVIAIAGLRVAKQMGKLSEEAKQKMSPMLDRVESISGRMEGLMHVMQDVATDVAPKIKRATTNIEESTDIYRAKIVQVESLIDDTTMKARRQTDRVDSMITNAMDRTHEITETVGNAIMSPARQMAGLVGGARATIDSLLRSFVPKSKPHTPKPIAFEGENSYTGLDDDYHA